MKCLLTSDIKAVKMSNLSTNGVARLPESLPSGTLIVTLVLSGQSEYNEGCSHLTIAIHPSHQLIATFLFPTGEGGRGWKHECCERV